MKKKTAITLLSILGGGVTFGSLTLLAINYEDNSKIVHEAPEPDPEENDNNNYNNGLTAMEEGKYEEAINDFISISSSYSKIDNVQKNLMLCLVSYTNDIRQKVDDIVSNPDADASAYTNAINLIDKGLEYLDNLSEKNITLSDKLKKDYTYVQTLIKIYKYRKDKKPFEALKFYKANESIFIDQPSFIDLKNPIMEECKDEINDEIDKYNFNQEYNKIIDCINGLSKDFINDYQSDKRSAENNLLRKIKEDISDSIEKRNYSNAKKIVDNNYKYLKKYDEFLELYDKWHNYSDSKLVYKEITDDSNIEKGEFSDIGGTKYNDVILLSKYNDEVSVEFALNKNYSNVSATLFLTNYKYDMNEEMTPLTVLVMDDCGNILDQYDNLTYKNSIKISTNIDNIKYLRIVIKGEKRYVKIGIVDGMLS